MYLLTTLPLLASAKLLIVARNSVYIILRRVEPQHSVEVEAILPLNWAPTSLPNTFKVFCILHMLWMCICICPYHVAAPLIGQACGSCLESCLYPQGQTTE